jgi:AcrR family transcriptional regulator
MKETLQAKTSVRTIRADMEPRAREQLLDTVLAELGEDRQEEIDLSRVLDKVGISFTAFEEEFADLDACLGAAYERLTRRLDAAVRAGCRLAGAGSRWPEQVSRGLEALLAELAADPRLTRALVRGFPSRGKREQSRYREFVESFGPLLSAGREYAGSEEDLPREVETLALGAAEAIAFVEIDAGRAGQLPLAAPAILFSLLVPFIGPAKAAEEVERSLREC